MTSPPLTCTDTTADNPVATRLTSFSSSPPPSRPFLPSSGPRAHETGHSARVGRGVSAQSQVSRRARAHKQQGTPLSTCKHAILLEATTPRSAAGTIPATSPHLYDAPWRRQAWRDKFAGFIVRFLPLSLGLRHVDRFRTCTSFSRRTVCFSWHCFLCHTRDPRATVAATPLEVWRSGHCELADSTPPILSRSLTLLLLAATAPASPR